MTEASSTPAASGRRPSQRTPSGPVRTAEQIVEIVSDSGEGAQKAGQSFAAICAQMGNGIWTVEIIPAEIKPPARSRAGASGIRVRFGSDRVTNMGDSADLVVAFNEQVLYGRISQDVYDEGLVILLENKWATDRREVVRREYAEALEDFDRRGYNVIGVPMEEECLKLTPTPRLGKNMFVLGMLSAIYTRDIDLALNEISRVFARKGPKVVELNQRLIRAGYDYAKENIDLSFEVLSAPREGKQVVMNGNQAAGLGVMASGMEMVAMYPITPATSISHYLAGVFPGVGGCVHQAEDEISAIGFAIGASYAGKTACTVTSGPGLALKTEFIGLAVMAEIPLVIILVQRGGPSTGLPTKVEQGELMPAIFGSPGDDPKIVFAPATIEECFHFVITARKLAETFRTPVVLLTDANLATGMQPFPRPEVKEEWLAPPIDQSPWDPEVPPYDWDEESGISPRPIPGQRGGEYVLTGLAHTRGGKVAYDPESNQTGCEMRSRKLAALRRTLKPPEVSGDPEGDLLIVGWGSTLGAIDEAVVRARSEGLRVASIHLRFLSPLEPGLDDIFARFTKVLVVEINYSDPHNAPYIDENTRRFSQLAKLIRIRTRYDVDCWSNVHGQPLSPGLVYGEIVRQIGALKGAER